MKLLFYKLLQTYIELILGLIIIFLILYGCSLTYTLSFTTTNQNLIELLNSDGAPEMIRVISYLLFIVATFLGSMIRDHEIYDFKNKIHKLFKIKNENI